jgi:hypothetical protein
MRFEEILPALKEGKKCRSVEWKPECFIYTDKYKVNFIDENTNLYELDAETILSEWEIYEEPKEKEKVKCYRALYKNKHSGNYRLSNMLYKDDTDAVKDVNIFEDFIRLITEIPELIEEREE